MGIRRCCQTLHQGLAGHVSHQWIPIFDLEKLTASFQQQMDFFDPGLCVVEIRIHRISHHGKFQCVGSLYPRTAILLTSSSNWQRSFLDSLDRAFVFSLLGCVLMPHIWKWGYVRYQVLNCSTFLSVWGTWLLILVSRCRRAQLFRLHVSRSHRIIPQHAAWIPLCLLWSVGNVRLFHFVVETIASKSDVLFRNLVGNIFVPLTMLNQQVRSADYLGMQSVTACNITCIRGN